MYSITSGRPNSSVEDEGVDADEEAGIGLVDEERHQGSVEGEDETRHQSRRKSHISVSVQDGGDVSRDGSRDSIYKTPMGTHSENSQAPPVRNRASDETGYFTAVSTVSSGLENPWADSQDCLAPPPPRQHLRSTYSSPLLPSESQDTVRPTTPEFQTSLLPSAAKTERPSTLTRRSITRMMPGPLASPLSSSLSAVVADSLRRGVDTSPTRRRSRPGIPQKSRSRQTAGTAAQLWSGEDPPASSASQTGNTAQQDDRSGSEETEELGSKPGTTTTTTRRSLSVNLGGFFWGKREQTGRAQADAGGEAAEERSTGQGLGQ